MIAKPFLAAAAFASAMLAAGTASAALQVQTVTVRPDSTLWQNLPAELRENATAGITATQARDGAGSLELTGPRTRFATGTIDPTKTSTPIAALSDVYGLAFDWMIAKDSVNPYNVDYTPALRLHIWDAGAGARKELIWEGAYNDVYGDKTVAGTWYTSGMTDKFYVTGGSVNEGRTIASWSTSFAKGSFVSGISVGSGGGAGAYHAFADNVTFTTADGTTVFNFEPAAAAAVPEPASWALFIGGFGLIGGALRHRKRAALRLA